MHTPRFYCQPIPGAGALFGLPPQAAHHAIRVLRLLPGDPVVVFDGSGVEFPARVASLAGAQCTVELGAAVWPAVESPLPILLGQGLAHTDKFDLVLQKAVELGVSAIAPLALRRSVVRLDPDRAQRRHQHWCNVVIAACEQCGRVRLPPVSAVQSLADWVASLPTGVVRLRLAPEAELGIAQLALASDPAAAAPGDSAPPPAAAGVALAIGPEGGFDPAEVEQLAAAGFIAVRLGPRILRTETAALAAIAALQSWHGDFRPTPL